MPNTLKIRTNLLLASLLFPKFMKLIQKLCDAKSVSITNTEIDQAMEALKSKNKADIEALPDEDADYKQIQETNIEQVCHWLGEFFKQANTYQQKKNSQHNRN